MLKNRLIAVLIVRDGTVVQSVQFRHTNVIHWKPLTAIDFFNTWAVDEIVVLDVSREYGDRQLFYDLLRGLSKKCFVPLAAGGWVRVPHDIHALLEAGADKVVMNTEAFRRPELIRESADIFGRQCIVVSIDTKMAGSGRREVVIDRGREATGVDPVTWALAAEAAGAGELFVNSIDHDGHRQGYDIPLLQAVTQAVHIPVIAFGGVLTWQHLVDGITLGGASAVAAANIFHYTEHSTRKAKRFMRDAGLPVREEGTATVSR